VLDQHLRNHGEFSQASGTGAGLAPAHANNKTNHHGSARTPFGDDSASTTTTAVARHDADDTAVALAEILDVLDVLLEPETSPTSTALDTNAYHHAANVHTAEHAENTAAAAAAANAAAVADAKDCDDLTALFELLSEEDHHNVDTQRAAAAAAAAVAELASRRSTMVPAAAAARAAPSAASRPAARAAALGATALGGRGGLVVPTLAAFAPPALTAADAFRKMVPRGLAVPVVVASKRPRSEARSAVSQKRHRVGGRFTASTIFWVGVNEESDEQLE
jgi:hypothetical protein